MLTPALHSRLNIVNTLCICMHVCAYRFVSAFVIDKVKFLFVEIAVTSNPAEASFFPRIAPAGTFDSPRARTAMQELQKLEDLAAVVFGRGSRSTGYCE
jgi:hypothetical protein